MSTDENKLDLFEMLTAILLGLAATATALVSHENSLWGGKSVEAYGEAATMTSKASNLDNSAVVDASQDANIEIEAKKLIREASRSKSEDDKEEALNLASYLLTGLLSDPAYKSFELPAEYREGAKVDEYLPQEALTAFSGKEELDQEYTDALFSESEEMFKQADNIFQQGRDANEIGDKFSFSAVLYAISLFFAGIASVLKTRVRWMVLTAGGVLLIASSAYAATLKWLPLF